MVTSKAAHRKERTTNSMFCTCNLQLSIHIPTCLAVLNYGHTEAKQITRPSCGAIIIHVYMCWFCFHSLCANDMFNIKVLMININVIVLLALFLEIIILAYLKQIIFHYPWMASDFLIDFLHNHFEQSALTCHWKGAGWLVVTIETHLHSLHFTSTRHISILYLLLIA